MRIHCLQHVPFEGLGYLEKLLRSEGIEISVTRLYLEETLPKISYEGLIVMGGPMNIYEDNKYSWLPLERAYIKEVIEQGVKVLGICLGSQFIADALGSKVYKGALKEIGWFPISTSDLLKPWKGIFDAKQMVFHWHGDTYDLPKDTILLAHSEAYKCQGFIYKHQVVGLQFHLEMGEYEIQHILDACGDEIHEAHESNHNFYVQSKEQILKETTYYEDNYRNLETIVKTLGWTS